MKHSPSFHPYSGTEALTEALELSFRILRYLLCVVVIAYVFSGFFIVRQHERAFVLHFGKLTDTPTRLMKPGFHLTFPRPFAEIIRVSTERTQTVQSDAFWLEQPTTPFLRGAFDASSNLASERFHYTLTGDANILHSQWAVHYKIADPKRVAFSIKDVDRVLRHELNHAVIKMGGRLTIDQALRTANESFRGAVEQEVQQRSQSLKLGVRILRVDRISGLPPPGVTGAFSAVVEAQQDQSTLINNARAYAASVMFTAEGQASKIQSEARTYKKQIVDEVAADAEYFKKMKRRYDRGWNVLSQVLLQETLQRALKNIDEKYIIHQGHDGTQEIRIRVSPAQNKPKPSFQSEIH